MRANGVPKYFGNKESKIQQKRPSLFPDSQETKYDPVVVEFMKIQLEICKLTQERKKMK